MIRHLKNFLWALLISLIVLHDVGYGKDVSGYNKYEVSGVVVMSHDNLDKKRLYKLKFFMAHIKEIAEEYAKEHKLEIENESLDITTLVIHNNSRDLKKNCDVNDNYYYYGLYHPLTRSIDVSNKDDYSTLCHEYGHHFFGADHGIVYPFEYWANARWEHIWSKWVKSGTYY